MITRLLSIRELSAEQIRAILDTAKAIAPSVRAEKPIPLLQGKTIVNLFFENSTRTRMSFELAIRKLSGSTLNFASSTSSTSKGETLLDTARNIEAMKPQAIVIRHPASGSPYLLSKSVSIPVINAGDGFHEHPTQALLDAFTMEERLGSLKGKNVVIMGDIAHSRVARSNIQCLNKLGAKVSVCGPPTLIPPFPEIFNVRHSYRPEPLLEEADVVMALRIQLERQNRMQIPSTQEYAKFWGLNSERVKRMKPKAIILHPGPINRGVEIDPEVADGNHSVILDQVFNGIIIRMAVLSMICNKEGLAKWTP